MNKPGSRGPCGRPMGGLGRGVETELGQGAFAQAQETLGKQLSGKWTGIRCRGLGHCEGTVAGGQACHVGIVFYVGGNAPEQGPGKGLLCRIQY